MKCETEAKRNHICGVTYLGVVIDAPHLHLTAVGQADEVFVLVNFDVLFSLVSGEYRRPFRCLQENRYVKHVERFKVRLNPLRNHFARWLGFIFKEYLLTCVDFLRARTSRVDVDLEFLAAFVYLHGWLNVFARRCIDRLVHHHQHKDCRNTRYYHIVVASISLAVEIAFRLLRSQYTFSVFFLFDE